MLRSLPSKRKRQASSDIPAWTQPAGRFACWKPLDGEAPEVVVIDDVSSTSVTIAFHDGSKRTLTADEVQYYLEPLIYKDETPYPVGLSQYVPLQKFQQQADGILVTHIVREGRPRAIWLGEVVSVRMEHNAEGFFQIKSFVTKQNVVTGASGRWLYTMKAAMRGLADMGIKLGEDEHQLFVCSEEQVIDIDTINEPVSVKPHYLFRAGMDDYYVKCHFDHNSKTLMPVLDTVVEDLLMCKYRSDPNLANDLHLMGVEEVRKKMKMALASRIARLKESQAGQDIDYTITWVGLLNFEDEFLQKAVLETFQSKVGRQVVDEVNVTWRVTCADLEPELGDDWNQLPISAKDKNSDRVVLDGTIIVRWCHKRPSKLRMRVEQISWKKANGVNLCTKAVEPPGRRLAFPPQPLSRFAAAASAAATSRAAAGADAAGPDAAAADQGSDSDSDSDDDLPMLVLAGRTTAGAATPKAAATATDSESDSDDDVPLGVLAKRMV